MRMPSLRELQAGVMHALLGGGAQSPAAVGASPLPAAPPAAAPISAAQLIAAHGISPALRLNVHANTAQTNFIESIAASYPAIRRLVGADYFRRCARGFHHRHPSRSGDLQPAGRWFADYLSAVHGEDEYRYLSDMARLEWSIQETLLAAEHPPLDLARLGAVAPADYDHLHFHLHPTVRLFASQYPCTRIWQANVGSEAEPDLIDLSSGGDRVLLMRHAGELRFLPLSPGEQVFLLALQSGERFADAVDRATAAGASAATEDGATRHGAAAGGFDAATALQRLVFAGVIVDFH